VIETNEQTNEKQLGMKTKNTNVTDKHKDE